MWKEDRKILPELTPGTVPLPELAIGCSSNSINSPVSTLLCTPTGHSAEMVRVPQLSLRLSHEWLRL